MECNVSFHLEQELAIHLTTIKVQKIQTEIYPTLYNRLEEYLTSRSKDIS